MKKGQFLFVVLSLLIFTHCKKANERTCFKSSGEDMELTIPIDSVRHFNLFNNIKYRIFQDDQRKVVVRGGGNMIDQIEVADNGDNVLSIENKNSCDFLRNPEDIVNVDIHYPFYRSFYIDPSDSVVFEDTVTSHYLDIEIRNGGGSVKLDVDVFEVSIVVSHGAGDFTIGGYAERSALKVQNNGGGNATKFNPDYAYIYQNSTADIFCELGNAASLIVVDGTGDVYYIGDPIDIHAEGKGNGKIIQL